MSGASGHPAGTAPSFERAASFTALCAAARNAARGKAISRETARFLLNIETECLLLRDELRDGVYRPRPYRTFQIRDPKPRTISAAAFRDRVVHHALCTEIAPWLERDAVASSYACRVGKGQRRALLHVQRLVRRYPYVLKLDIEHFFETMSHAVLLRLLGRRLRHDRALVALAQAFVAAGAPGSAAGCGVPIGNLTSQHFANFYLGPLDRLLQSQLRVPAVRYMDDIVVFADSKQDLWKIHDAVRAFVVARLKVRLKSAVTRLIPSSDGVPFLGFRVYPNQLRFDNVRRRRFVRKLRRAYRQYEHDPVSAQASATSLIGWARHGATEALRRSLLARYEDAPPMRFDATKVKVQSGSNRVNRGGSWNNNAQNARAANRNNNTPGNQNNNLGVRLASTGSGHDEHHVDRSVAFCSAVPARVGASTESSSVHRSRPFAP